MPDPGSGGELTVVLAVELLRVGGGGEQEEEGDGGVAAGSDNEQPPPSFNLQHAAKQIEMSTTSVIIYILQTGVAVADHPLGHLRHEEAGQVAKPVSYSVQCT